MEHQSTPNDGDRQRPQSHAVSRGRGEGGVRQEAFGGSDLERRKAIADKAQALRQKLARGWPEKGLRGWNETGFWRDSCDGGPAVTAFVAVVLGFIGKLDDGLARAINRYLKHQRFTAAGLNGGFPSYPGGPSADLGATATCYAGLIATGSDDNDPRVAQAKRFIDTHGGETALLALAQAGDLSALALAMVKKLGAPLPKASALLGLTPGSEYLIEQRFAYILPFRSLASDVLVGYLADPRAANQLRLPRLRQIPRSARELSDLVTRRLSAAADGAATTAESAARSGADATGSVVKSATEAVIGIAQGSRSVAAGVVDSLRSRSFGPFKAAARAVVGSAIQAVTTAGRLKPDVLGVGRNAVQELEGFRCQLYLERFRNEDGSWLYGDAIHTALALAAYRALGYAPTDPTLTESVDWLTTDPMMVRRKVDGEDEAYFNVFYTDIWPTAFVVRALLESGTPVTDPALSRAINWLIAVQRSGSYAFQATNTTTSDLDDTAVALASLAIARDALRGSGGASATQIDPNLGPREHELLPARCDAAIEASRAFLRANQNADGGWASYQPHLPSKPPGAIMKEPPDVSKIAGLANQIGFAIKPPAEFGDPATEDVTGRVLFALGRSGVRADDPTVKKAIQFLVDQQDQNHGWWGRWVVNYVAATAWVLRGLAAVEADLEAAFVRQAVTFLLGRQRPDGGWADTVESYREPDQRMAEGVPSNPCLTGLVLCALIELGEASEEVERGVDFIVGHAAREEDTLHTLYPPTLFYTLPLTELQLPLEALGLYAQYQRGRKAKSTGSLIEATTGEGGDDADEADPFQALASTLSSAQVKALKEKGDELADDLITAIFQEQGPTLGAAQINTILEALTTLADSDPASLAKLSTTLGRRAEEFLAALPDLQLDPQRLENARGLFRKAGFGVPLVLFCSSLPQCYAVPYGARVLVSSGRLETSPKRRLVETAQLVFDVLAPGGLTAPSAEQMNAARAAGQRVPGSGIRTARKVRLMHAAIRKLLREGRPDPTGEVPISQFELIGTLMTFSVVVTDGLRALGLTVTEQEANDWFHVWLAVGSLLGIEIPQGVSLATAADGADYFAHVREDWAPSPEGTELAKVTLGVMKDLLPGSELDGVGATLVRHLAGERCADILGIEPADWTKTFLGPSPLVTTFLGRVLGQVFETPMTPLLQQAAFGTMEALAGLERQGKGVPFSIPEPLINDWRNQFQARFRRG